MHFPSPSRLRCQQVNSLHAIPTQEVNCSCSHAGVVAAGVVGILAAAVLLFLFARTRRRRAEHLLALHSSGPSPAKSGASHPPAAPFCFPQNPFKASPHRCSSCICASCMRCCVYGLSGSSLRPFCSASLHLMMEARTCDSVCVGAACWLLCFGSAKANSILLGVKGCRRGMHGAAALTGRGGCGVPPLRGQQTGGALPTCAGSPRWRRLVRARSALGAATPGRLTPGRYTSSSALMACPGCSARGPVDRCGSLPFPSRSKIW